jgi:hypothetical protein
MEEKKGLRVFVMVGYGMVVRNQKRGDRNCIQKGEKERIMSISNSCRHRKEGVQSAKCRKRIKSWLRRTNCKNERTSFGIRRGEKGTANRKE